MASAIEISEDKVNAVALAAMAGVRQRRVQMGIRQGEVARAADISQQTLARNERVADVSLARFLRLAASVGLDPAAALAEAISQCGGMGGAA